MEKGMPMLTVKQVVTENSEVRFVRLLDDEITRNEIPHLIKFNI